jgi:hypothetical protein
VWYVAMLLELDSGETLKPDRNTVRSGEDRAEVLEAMAREVMREDTDVIALWEMDRKVLPLGKTVEEAAEEYVRWMYPSRLLVSSPWGEFLELHAKYMKRVSL